MSRIASIAMGAALGVASMAQSLPADAHPDVSVGIGFPGGAVVQPLPYASVYDAPYYYTHARYWSHGDDRCRHDRFRHGRWHRR